MKYKNLKRPDKLIIEGIKTLTSLNVNLNLNPYSRQRSDAKAKAELTFIGMKKVEEVQSQLYEYNQGAYKKTEKLKDFDQLKSPKPGKTLWLNFHGIHDVKIIQQIGELLELDRITVRQILDTTLRPKVEGYDHYLFVSVKSILKEEAKELNVEQLSFVLGEHYLVSFQEEVGDHFEGIRNKIQESLGYVRRRKNDFLLAQLLDAVLDNYFETIDQINAELVSLEQEVLKRPSNNTLLKLERYKRSTQIIKKALGPFKEALLNILNRETILIRKGNLRYYKDLANSATAAIEEIDSTAKTLEGFTNIYFASLSQKMNETMKVLTTVATIFIPLTFIAGIYGMNFDYMPELQYRNGYFMVWGIMGVIAVGMLIYFRRKKWI